MSEHPEEPGRRWRNIIVPHRYVGFIAAAFACGSLGVAAVGRWYLGWGDDLLSDMAPFACGAFITAGMAWSMMR